MLAVGDAWKSERVQAILREIFAAAIASAAPDAAIRRHLPEKPNGRCIVVGAGKASAAMAAAVDVARSDYRGTLPGAGCCGSNREACRLGATDPWRRARRGNPGAWNNVGRHRPVGTYPWFAHCAGGDPAFGRRDDSDHRV